MILCFIAVIFQRYVCCELTQYHVENGVQSEVMMAVSVLQAFVIITLQLILSYD